MSIPVTPRRTEPLLLPKLRTLFPDVTFDTIERSDLEPPFTEALCRLHARHEHPNPRSTCGCG